MCWISGAVSAESEPNHVSIGRLAWSSLCFGVEPVISMMHIPVSQQYEVVTLRELRASLAYRRSFWVTTALLGPACPWDTRPS